MNISRAARTALIPIERTIIAKPVEYAYQLDRQGNILSANIGTRTCVSSPFTKGARIGTHNHPALKKRTSVSNGLSPNDIGAGIEKCHNETRSVFNIKNIGNFCHLVEIPPLDRATKERLFNIVDAQDYLLRKNVGIFSFSNSKKLTKLTGEFYKELEKVGGLKFRTIKLPEFENPLQKTNIFSRFWDKLTSKF